MTDSADNITPLARALPELPNTVFGLWRLLLGGWLSSRRDDLAPPKPPFPQTHPFPSCPDSSGDLASSQDDFKMAQTSSPAAHVPLKQKVALGLKSLVAGARQLARGADERPGPAPMTELFPKTDPAIDGEECTHDCDSCHIKYPRNFSIDTEDLLYGHVNAWSVHVLVATGKSDWKRDVATEKGSLMEAIDRAGAKAGDGGKVMLSASDIPVPGHGGPDYSRPTTVLVLPAFTLVDDVTPAKAPHLITGIIAKAPTTTSPLTPLAAADEAASALIQRPCPHSAIILLCSQRTRDARCGQSAPLLRREFERHLRPLGLQRDADDDRPGGVGIYFISHVGGHKYSANVMIYRRPVVEATAGQADGSEEEDEDVGAGQCIWLARVRPEDCENIIRYTVLRGKVVKPETQLRGGFDRAKGLMSW